MGGGGGGGLGKEAHTVLIRWILQSDIPQSKLLFGTRGDEQFPTHMSLSKKLQQPLSKRLKHLIRPTLQAELHACRSECVLHVHGIGRGREKVESHTYICAHYMHAKSWLYSHPQCCSLLVIVANPDLAGLTHTPQSVLRVVDKVPFGGVVMMLEVLPPTLAVQVGPVTHSKSNWERVGFPVHSEEPPVQV